MYPIEYVTIRQAKLANITPILDYHAKTQNKYGNEITVLSQPGSYPCAQTISDSKLSRKLKRLKLETETMAQFSSTLLETSMVQWSMIIEKGYSYSLILYWTNSSLKHFGDRCTCDCFHHKVHLHRGTHQTLRSREITSHDRKTWHILICGKVGEGIHQSSHHSKYLATLGNVC